MRRIQLEDSNPLLFEEILKPRVIELLESDADDDLLKRILSFYEEMAKMSGEEVLNRLWIAITGPQVYDKKLIAKAWKYLGEATKDMAREIAKRRGWEGDLPADGSVLPDEPANALAYFSTAPAGGAAVYLLSGPE